MSSKIKKLLPTWYTKLRQKYRAEKHKKKIVREYEGPHASQEVSSMSKSNLLITLLSKPPINFMIRTPPCRKKLYVAKNY